jgi:hypothetical protein
MKAAGASAKAWLLGYLHSDDQMTPISGCGTGPKFLAAQHFRQLWRVSLHGQRVDPTTAHDPLRTWTCAGQLQRNNCQYEG